MYRLSDWLRREALTLILAMLLIAGCLNLAVAAHGLRDLLLLQHHRTRLEAEREHEQSVNRKLEATVAKLQSNDAYLQRLIRKELGFARPNELIYRFGTDSSTAPSNSATP
jgi:cell division protein FtsB